MRDTGKLNDAQREYAVERLATFESPSAIAPAGEMSDLERLRGMAKIIQESDCRRYRGGGERTKEELQQEWLHW